MMFDKSTDSHQQAVDRFWRNYLSLLEKCLFKSILYHGCLDTPMSTLP